MKQRAALVTGGSSGIGRACALALAADGYAVTICGRDSLRLEDAVEQLRAAGAPALGVVADLGQEAAIDGLIARHAECHGRMDVLVNSAVDTRVGVLLQDLPTELLDAHLTLDLRAQFLLIRGSLAMLTRAGAEHGKALIVNVSSNVAREAAPAMSFYSAAKAGVEALTAAVQAEVELMGVQCTTLVPATVATPSTAWMGRAGVVDEEKVQPTDLAEGLRLLLRTSPSCLIREIAFRPPGQRGIGERVAAYLSRQGSN